jgi:hypothetical protein
MAQTTEHFGWAFDPPRQYKWVGQVIEVPFRGFDLAQRAHSIKRAAFGRRRENRDTAPPVCDLDRFASFDTSQELAGSLSEFANADRYHVLLIAQSLNRRLLGACPVITTWNTAGGAESEDLAQFLAVNSRFTDTLAGGSGLDRGSTSPVIAEGRVHCTPDISRRPTPK